MLGKSLKALVPIVVGFVFTILSQFGVNVDPEFQIGVISILTTVIVWLVPNKVE